METRYTQNDIAYLAGYLDGDGCFYVGFERPKKRLTPKAVVSLVISSVNKHTLLHFKSLFGGSVTLVKKEHDNNKALYHYTLAKHGFLSIAHNLLHYLVEKKQECLMAIEFAHTANKTEQHYIMTQLRLHKDVANLVSKYHVAELNMLAKTIKPTEQDYAYLAGFIDAECCFGISTYTAKNKPNKLYKMTLSCNNTKWPSLKWAIERFGGTVVFINRLRHQKARKNQLMWRITGKALSFILPDLKTHLIHKKPVCDQLIQFYQTTLVNGGARHTDTFRNHYAQVLKVREQIVEKVHELNRKGIKHL